MMIIIDHGLLCQNNDEHNGSRHKLLVCREYGPGGKSNEGGDRAGKDEPTQMK